jgi:hypothetical protein
MILRWPITARNPQAAIAKSRAAMTPVLQAYQREKSSVRGVQ